MRKILALAFAITLSVCAIGSPGPDHQTPDITAVYDHEAVSFELAVASPVIEFVSVELLKSEMEAEFLLVTNDLFIADSIVTNQLDINASAIATQDFTNAINAVLSDPVLLIKGDTDEVVEITHKARDSYKLPIWDYIPTIKPPSNTK